MEQYYHLNCSKCGYDYWSSDGFPKFCPHCGKLFKLCSYYKLRLDGVQLCYGTEKVQECDCYGNELKCTFKY